MRRTLIGDMKTKDDDEILTASRSLCAIPAFNETRPMSQRGKTVADDDGGLNKERIR